MVPLKCGERTYSLYLIQVPNPKYSESTSLRHRRQAASRIRHKLQVNQRRLYRRVAEPAGEIVYRHPVHQ